MKSLDCLRPLGMMVLYGAASGSPPPFDLSLLAPKGSLFVTRPTLFTHIATRESTQAMADDLFAMVKSGAVKIRIDQRYPLADVAKVNGKYIQDYANDERLLQGYRCPVGPAARVVPVSG